VDSAYNQSLARLNGVTAAALSAQAGTTFFTIP
jgi:hypothetical protein